jgi:SPP1 family predicted phage head-tail adaptor
MDIRPLTGREQVVASQMVATSTHVFTMRYSSSGAVGISIVNPTHRLNFRGRIFHVDQPPKDPDEQNRQLDIYCTEQVVPV